MLAAVAGTLLLAGCRVDTRVSVVERPGGDGTVAVTVTFDDSAVKALGGLTVLAKQLSDADLQSAGWTVSGPTLASGGGASVTVSHGFSDGAELSRLLSAVAGSGTAGGAHPFRLTVSHGGGFWTDRTAVNGTVDLRCGLDCFGDPGLQASLGSPTGVSSNPLARASGETPAQVFSFQLAVRLPGHVDASAGRPAAARDGTLTWSAPLGSAVAVGAVSESVDWTHVIVVAVLGGLLIAGGGGFGWRVVRRRRRKSAPGDVDLVPALAGETSSADPGGDLTAWPRV